jgi:hypothetical protein
VSIYLPKLPDVISLTTTSEFWSDVANFDLVDVSNMSTSMYSITGLSELLQSVIINKQVSIPLSIAERIKYNKDNLMQMVKNYMLIDFEDVNNLIDMYDNDKHYEVPVIPFGDVLSKFFEYKKISEIEQYILGLGKGLKPEERRKLVSMNALSYSSANTYLNIGEYFQCVDITEPEEKPRNADYITYVKLCEDLNTYYESDNKTREAELDTTAVSCESLIHETLTNIVSICTKQDLISSKDGKPEQLDMSIPEGFAEVYMDNDSTVKLLKEEMEKLFEAVRNVDYSDYGCCDDKDEEWERDHHFSDWEDNTIYNSSGDIWHNRVADEIDSLDEDDEWLDDEDSYYDDKYSYDYSNDEEYSYEY